MLVILDGGSDLPGFAVIPAPHESDKDYHQSKGECWFRPIKDGIDGDIGGCLHEFYHDVGRKIDKMAEEYDKEASELAFWLKGRKEQTK